MFILEWSGHSVAIHEDFKNELVLQATEVSTGMRIPLQGYLRTVGDVRRALDKGLKEWGQMKIDNIISLFPTINEV
jgi:hypothetical protein